MPNDSGVSSTRGALLKIEGVIRLTGSDPTVMSNLKNNPVRFLNESGIHLTQDEYQALLDVVHGTKLSVFAEPPEGAPFDRMDDLKKLWEGVDFEEMGKFNSGTHHVL